MIQAIFFDLDGVLVDAADLHYEALNRALRNVANYEISRVDHLERFNGLPTRDKLVKLVADGVVQREQLAPIGSLKQIYIQALASQHIWPDSEKVEMCKALGRKYTLVVVSNCVRQSVEMLLNLAGIRNYFFWCYSNQDVPLAKPNPAIYQYALSQTRFRSENVLAVEDHERGVEAAREAGVHVVQLQYPQVTYVAIMDAIEALDSLDERKM